jgi:hypothetical protein
MNMKSVLASDVEIEFKVMTDAERKTSANWICAVRYLREAVQETQIDTTQGAFFRACHHHGRLVSATPRPHRRTDRIAG